MSKPITDFINNELKPRLFDYIPAVFPNMEFKRKGNKWISELHIDGSEGTGHKADRAVIKEGYTSVWDTTRQYSKDIISLFMEKNGIDIVEAVNRLCDIVCIDKPTYTPEALEAYRKAEERRTLLEQSADRQQAALFQAEGKEVLDYLRRRGWTPEEIMEAGLGYISVEEAKTIGAQYGVGDNYNLSIPIYSGSTLHGFKFRITTDNKNKDLPKYTILQGTNTQKVLFNLTGAQQQDGNIIVVESELDTLHAKVKGLEGIVATGGGGLTEELLKQAYERGIRRITLLLDNDEAGGRYTQKSIETAYKHDVYPLVATLPDGIKDVDEFLSKHTADELNNIITNAEQGSIYLYQNIIDEFVKENNGTLYAEGELRLRERVIDLAKRIENPMERNRIATRYTTLVKENGIKIFSTESFLALVNKSRVGDNALKQEKITQTAVERAGTLLKDGDTAGAVKVMEQAVKDYSKVETIDKYAHLLTLPTIENLLDKLKHKKEELSTNYTLSNGKEEEVFTIPVGAITIVAAPTSHGKSTLLQNLALQVSAGEGEGTILYFTLEEDEESVVLQLLNKYMRLELCNNYSSKYSNNIRALQHYFRANEYLDKYRYIRERDKEGNDNYSIFDAKREEFLREIYATGKIRIFYEGYNSNELINAISYLCSQMKVKAVFIDYVQLLYKGNSKLQRTEEIKEICRDLKNLAIEQQLPIVMAAQFNREATSPAKLHSQGLGEAGDLERIANKILCVWNSAFTSQEEKTPKEVHELEKRGFILGTGGKIYAKLTKNRGGVVNLDAIWDFDGNTGVITQPPKQNNNLLF